MNFQGFSPESFEQLIRALALKVIGPGVNIFGNGPDGGREAVFRGKVNFPFPPNDVWDGYGVLQAKFKEKTEGTQKDQEWAARQLSKELQVWKDSENRSPKPDYFIFCTNVELSSASNGGKAQLEKILDEYQKDSNLKSYMIWDSNQLVGYISTESEIRTRFNAFLTTGDLLAQFSKVLTKLHSPDSILTTYISKEILADEDARLSQAGDRSEDRIRLASVYTDLPVDNIQNIDLLEEDYADNEGAVKKLLRASGQKLDPLALNELKLNNDRIDEQFENVYGRFVFLGGPGSGKSTIGQFLAQIHRAALLDRRPAHRLENKIKNVIKDIKQKCKEDNFIWPQTPRYPFRVELNSFAKSLASGTVSFSEYLRKNLSKDTLISHEDLRDWLKAFPWLLILDGLDEVPTSSNRGQVIDEIQVFLNEARDVEADLMIVASSRPDGYAGEFDGEEVLQQFLQPLKKTQALNCAQKYVDAKISQKGDQRAIEAMEILNSAISNPLVAKLMRSPLQVTFMVTVVSASGKPSESRWQLFNDYYRTIYERELHKAVHPFDKALNERRQDIDALHHRVGFILQCRAENSGGTQSDLSMEEFDELVVACLQENGLSPEELENQKEMILGAANQRLVFLTSRTPGRLSFDVRSLQEYMAAACITNADSSEIFDRLTTIAHSAYWRNTFLFSVGRFFVEPLMRNHRDKIILICQDLNKVDQERSLNKLGSRLALEIIESGTVGNVPIINRHLADCALDLLELYPSYPDSVLYRVSKIYDNSLIEEFKKKINLYLCQTDTYKTLSAWMLLFYLEKNSIQWVQDLISKHWPVDPEIRLILNKTWLDSSNLYLNERQRTLDINEANRIASIIPFVSPNDISFELRNCSLENLNVVELPNWMLSIWNFWNQDDRIKAEVTVLNKKIGYNVSFVPLPNNDLLKYVEGLRHFCLIDNLHDNWRWLSFILDFCMQPSKESLSKTLILISEQVAPEYWSYFRSKVAWPLGVCLADATTSVELKDLANAVQNGAFGDYIDWKEYEDKWVSENVGIDIDLLCVECFEGGPHFYDGVVSASYTGGNEEEFVDAGKYLLDKIKSTKKNKQKNNLAWITSFYLSCTSTIHLHSPEEVNDLLPFLKHISTQEFLSKKVEKLPNFKDWILFYEKLGNNPLLKYSLGGWRVNHAPIELLINEFNNDTNKTGILRLLASWISLGAKHDSLTNNIEINNYESQFTLSAIVLILSKKEVSITDVEKIISKIEHIVSLKDEFGSINMFINALDRFMKNVPNIEKIFYSLIQVMESSDCDLISRLQVSSFKLLQSKHSGYNKVMLSKLNLPHI